MDISANVPTAIGIAASVFTACSLLPQLIKLIRDKKAEDISLAMLGVLFTGLVLWIIYGVYKKDYIIILSNAFSVIVNVATTILSIRYKQK